MRYDIKLQKGAKLIVFGDVHEHEEQFDKLLDEITPSPENILVSVGDIYDKGFGANVAESITNKLMKLAKQGNTYAIRGNHELSSIRNAKRKKKMTKQLKWWDKQPLSLSFSFENRSRVSVVHGGVLPSHSWEDLATNIDTCYVRYVNKKGEYVKRLKVLEGDRLTMVNAEPGKLWHELYDGRFGYIVSGHNSQKDGIAKFYNYSCNLDTAVYNTGKLTAQVFVDGMKEKLLTFVGTPKYPDIKEMERLMAKGRI